LRLEKSILTFDEKKGKSDKEGEKENRKCSTRWPYVRSSRFVLLPGRSGAGSREEFLDWYGPSAHEATWRVGRDR
jgi:hypothetical protein